MPLPPPTRFVSCLLRFILACDIVADKTQGHTHSKRTSRS